MIQETCQELVNHFSLSFSKLVFQFELNIFLFLEDLETKCVAVSSVMPPGENDLRNLSRAGESLISFFFNDGVVVLT